MLIIYRGEGEYVDPRGRFVANTGDVVDIDDDEAAALVEAGGWEPAGRGRRERAAEVRENA